MASPLPIVIRVATVVTSCVKSLQVYSDVTAHFNALSVSEILTQTEFDSVATLLQRILDVLLSRPRLAAQWASSEDLPGKALQSTMETCERIFAIVTDELYELTNESLETCQPWSTKAQFVQLWNTSGVKIALQHISALVPALDLLHSVLIIEGKAEMMDILTDKRSRDTFARLACGAHRWKAKRKSVLRRPESDPLRLATPVPANIDFDLDSYFVHSEPYRSAWVSAKSKSSSDPVTHPAYRRHEPTDLARATSSVQAVPQRIDQLSYHRSEVREVSKMQEIWSQVRRDSGEIGRMATHYLAVLDPRASMHDNDPVRFVKNLPRLDCPPPPYTQTTSKVQGKIANHANDSQVPDMFSLLDHPPIAQAVLNSTFE